MAITRLHHLLSLITEFRLTTAFGTSNYHARPAKLIAIYRGNTISLFVLNRQPPWDAVADRV